MVLSSYDDEIYILGSVHHVLKIGSHLSSQIKKLQWLTIRTEHMATVLPANSEHLVVTFYFEVGHQQYDYASPPNSDNGIQLERISSLSKHSYVTRLETVNDSV